MANERVAPDQRELTEETKKPAERGSPKPERALSGAHTWLQEAHRSARAAIRYYRTAGDLYRDSGHVSLAQDSYRIATTISRAIGED